MRRYLILATCLVLGLAALGTQGVTAQQTSQPPTSPPPTFIPDIKFASGREVVPYLVGWIRNPDGSFDFVFGYYYRNT